jgi:hypothetical protein
MIARQQCEGILTWTTSKNKDLITNSAKRHVRACGSLHEKENKKTSCSLVSFVVKEHLLKGETA